MMLRRDLFVSRNEKTKALEQLHFGMLEVLML